jgi:6-phosphogluconolactonase
MKEEDLLQQQNHPLALSRRGFVTGAVAVAIANSPIAFASKVGEVTSSRKIFAYIGTYTDAPGSTGNGEGIYACELAPRTGELSSLRLAAKSHSPTWLAFDPTGRYLYAANEVSNFNGKHGSVSAFAVNRSTGDLTLLNVVSSEGAGPAHLSVDPSAKYVFVANYIAGNIAVLPILPNGALGAATDVHQDTGALGSKKATDAPPGSFAISGHDAPHPHMIHIAPGNRFVVQTDLGQDRIYVYSFDSSSGKLTPASTPFINMPSGDGPRHFAFHPNGRWMYSLQEESSTLAFFLYDPLTGAFKQQQTLSSLPPGFTGSNFTSEVMVSHDGRFLYAANRLHDSISIFSISPIGRLAYVGQQSTFGDYPRHFNIDPSGNFLYSCNQRSDAITSFRIDHQTGLLKPTGRYIPVGSPSAIVFLP